MSKLTQIKDIIEDDTSLLASPRRSTRLATKRLSTDSDDIITTATPAKVTRSKRISSDSSDLNGKDLSATVMSKDLNKNGVSPTNSNVDGPAKRTRRRSSATEDELDKKLYSSPTPSRIMTRRSSNRRSISVSPTYENSKTTQSNDISPVVQIEKISFTGTPRRRARKTLVAEKICPLEAIEETDTKALIDVDKIENEKETYIDILVDDAVFSKEKLVETNKNSNNIAEANINKNSSNSNLDDNMNTENICTDSRDREKSNAIKLIEKTSPVKILSNSFSDNKKNSNQDEPLSNTSESNNSSQSANTSNSSNKENRLSTVNSEKIKTPNDKLELENKLHTTIDPKNILLEQMSIDNYPPDTDTDESFNKSRANEKNVNESLNKSEHYSVNQNNGSILSPVISIQMNSSTNTEKNSEFKFTEKEVKTNTFSNSTPKRNKIAINTSKMNTSTTKKETKESETNDKISENRKVKQNSFKETDDSSNGSNYQCSPILNKRNNSFNKSLKSTIDNNSDTTRNDEYTKNNEKSLSEKSSNSNGETEEPTHKLDELITELVDQSSDSESENPASKFIDEMASEADEDESVSQGSNDIIEEGESLGSKDTDNELDDSFSEEPSSFIVDDNEELIELLSGDEYDLGQDKKRSSLVGKRLMSHANDESEEETNIVETEPKEKLTNNKNALLPNNAEANSSFSDNNKSNASLTVDVLNTKEPTLKSNIKSECNRIMINENDGLVSLEKLNRNSFSQVKILRESPSTKSETITKTTPQRNTSTIFTPNNSIVILDTPVSSKKSKNASINLQENIRPENLNEDEITKRISKVVNVFCSTLKTLPGEEIENISLNVSVEVIKTPVSQSANASINKNSSINNLLEAIDLEKETSQEKPSVSSFEEAQPLKDTQQPLKSPSQSKEQIAHLIKDTSGSSENSRDFVTVSNNKIRQKLLKDRKKRKYNLRTDLDSEDEIFQNLEDKESSCSNSYNSSISEDIDEVFEAKYNKKPKLNVHTQAKVLTDNQESKSSRQNEIVTFKKFIETRYNSPQFKPDKRSTEGSKINAPYFPSQILGESSKPVNRKKAKLVPSISSEQDSWTCELINNVLPSSSTCKKTKKNTGQNISSGISSKDFKTATLYNPKRHQRIDASQLKKQQKKIAFS